MLADGTRAISNAILEEFGDSTIRLMCWSHTHTAYSKQLKRVKNPERRDQIDQDIKSVQWMVQNEEEFKNVLELLVQKHLEEVAGSADETAAVRSFFDYFFEQWGPDSHCSRYRTR